MCRSCRRIWPVCFVAMVSGVAAIGLVKRLTSKGRFGAFSYYCWGAGALTMILSLIF